MFSVVIPLYNKAHTIVRTIKSVLNQNFTNYEIIIVNDGSTDNSIEVIKNSFSDQRIKVFNQHNQGVSVARNRGVMEAKNEYIAFLDGDDEWFCEYLFQMNNVIENYPSAGMYCCAGVVRDNDFEHIRLARKYRDRILEVNYFENPHVFSHTSGTIVRKEIFLLTQGFPPGMKCNQDFALFYSIALISKVVYCGKLLTIYNGGVEGQITSSSIEKQFDLLKHVVDRVNLCYNLWVKTLKLNKLYIVFDKYETRTRMLGFLKTKNYKSIHYYYNALESNLLSEFPRFEISLIKNEKLNFIAQIYIYFTKIVWRVNRFPVAGEVKSIKLNK